MEAPALALLAEPPPAAAIASTSPSTSSAAIATFAVRQGSGARTDTGSDSSSTAAGPDAPTNAVRPRAMRTPRPPHHGQRIVPMPVTLSSGMRPPPIAPIRRRRWS